MHASEIQKLVETGFEYVCSHEDTMLFRKRKRKGTLNDASYKI